MSNMSYCRHENTAGDLADVVEQWEDFIPEDSNDYERAGRARIVELAREIVNIVDNE